METELWPNLLAQMSGAECPAVLVNARLSERSAQRLRRWNWLAQPAVQRLAAIVAQTPDDAERFSVNGAKPSAIEVSGNMKFDLEVPEHLVHQGREWRHAVGERQVWLAVSTRDDEEIALLKVWSEARKAGRLSASDLLVLVPRHPQRFERVNGLIEHAGLKGCRRTSQTPSLDHAVWLGDSLGEMFAYLELSNLVLVGGSLIPLGGQNPIEACALGKPVFFGPHMFNFHQIAQALQDEGLGTQIQSADAWVSEGQRLLASPDRLVDVRERAARFMHKHQGASQRTLRTLMSIGRAGR